MSEPTRSDERYDLLTKREVFALVALHALMLDAKYNYTLSQLGEQSVLVADELQKHLNESRGNFVIE